MKEAEPERLSFLSATSASQWWPDDQWSNATFSPCVWTSLHKVLNTQRRTSPRMPSVLWGAYSNVTCHSTPLLGISLLGSELPSMEGCCIPFGQAEPKPGHTSAEPGLRNGAWSRFLGLCRFSPAVLECEGTEDAAHRGSCLQGTVELGTAPHFFWVWFLTCGMLCELPVTGRGADSGEE